MKIIAILLAGSGLCLGPAPAGAEDYSLDWYKVSAGGSEIAGGNFTLQSTIGQPDAGSTLTGGGYSLTGGFWSLLTVVNNPGLPALHISLAPTGVTLSWLGNGNYTLQQTPSATGGSGNWSTANYPVTTVNGTNRVTIPQPAGNWFFRLQGSGG